MKRQLNRATQRGQGAVEFVIIFVLFLALLTGLFEMTRVFRTKHTLNAATFSAARAGALSNARLEPMNAELANGMALLFSQGATPSGLVSALAKAQAFGLALDAVGGGVQIVSPTRQIFNQLHTTQYLPNEDDTALQAVDVIPNDNLRWRPAGNAKINANGQQFDINLQDANLLKVRSLWCHRLVVPALDRLIYNVVNALPFASSRQAVCNAISIGGATAGVAPGYYLAISADATLRMQSPVVSNDLP